MAGVFVASYLLGFFLSSRNLWGSRVLFACDASFSSSYVSFLHFTFLCAHCLPFFPLRCCRHWALVSIEPTLLCSWKVVNGAASFLFFHWDAFYLGLLYVLPYSRSLCFIFLIPPHLTSTTIMVFTTSRERIGVWVETFLGTW